ncbi:hypothetical protein KN1_23840 [Stygiolobus caldivivus]|uniref:Uncharacterized protein n=1 Tax=Stygiolobus caldivivus TaxID=2824673 RepID=A0A8D5ZKB6_9CREN|nr:hypothetical protein KN1_23840 [Stygiolobus caldivivus]
MVFLACTHEGTLPEYLYHEAYKLSRETAPAKVKTALVFIVIRTLII